MAASNHLNRTEVEKRLECELCLERLDNPKMLDCSHSFCKSCLDTILEFQKDGSARIECPFRCKKKTVLKNHETTNDLQARFAGHVSQSCVIIIYKDRAQNS